jgi:hypothetical protein
MDIQWMGSTSASRKIAGSAGVLGLLGLMALVSTGGCHRQTGTAGAQPVSGVFVLQSVDGAALPAKVVHGNAVLEVRSGTMTFHEDGTCVSRTVFVPPSGLEVSREVMADYSRDGADLRMTWRGAGKTVGTIDGTSFTMNNEGMIFAYRQ